jgi:prepilin-type N-terminal cleavage/methylation domain-containing protein
MAVDTTRFWESQVRRSGRTHGFTLVELLAAMVAGSVLVLSVGIMLNYGYRGWNRNSANVDMQLDGAAVMKTVNRYVREARAVDITVASGSLSIRNTNSMVTVRLYQSGSNLVFDPNTAVSGNEMTMIRGRVTSFTPSWQTNRVAVTLMLNQGSETVLLTSAVTFRN